MSFLSYVLSFIDLVSASKLAREIKYACLLIKKMF